MSELTKEWLQQTIAELEEERDAVPGAVNEDAAIALRAMKLALASLEAEPIGFAFADDLDLMRKKKKIGGMLTVRHHGEIAVYTAPPAPVSVPDAISTRQAIAKIENHEPCDSINVAYKFGWNACRAAMLQGAEPVSNRDELPDGWVACSERMPKKGEEVLCTDQFENYETALYDTGYIP